MWLLLHQQCWWELAYFSIWSFRQFHLRLLSITGVSVQDVTGALVCSRGTQLFLIYNCQVHRAEHARPLPIKTTQTVGSHTHM